MELVLDVFPEFKLESDPWLAEVRSGHCPFIPEPVWCVDYRRTEYRRNSIERYLSKYRRRDWTRRIRYEGRSQFAKKRRRVGGRFVKTE